MTICRFEQTLLKDQSTQSNQIDSTQPKKRKPRKPEAYAVQQIIVEDKRLTLILPVKVCNEGNSTEHWSSKYKRHKRQQDYLSLILAPYREIITLPCNVLQCRYAPRELDAQDNLPYSHKWCTDAIANFLVPGLKAGRADSDQRISWSFSQQKTSYYGIKIVFDFK